MYKVGHVLNNCGDVPHGNKPKQFVQPTFGLALEEANHRCMNKGKINQIQNNHLLIENSGPKPSFIKTRVQNNCSQSLTIINPTVSSMHDHS